MNISLIDEIQRGLSRFGFLPEFRYRYRHLLLGSQTIIPEMFIQIYAWFGVILSTGIIMLIDTDGWNHLRLTSLMPIKIRSYGLVNGPNYVIIFPPYTYPLAFPDKARLTNSKPGFTSRRYFFKNAESKLSFSGSMPGLRIRMLSTYNGKEKGKWLMIHFLLAIWYNIASRFTIL